nr:fimbria/pilus periplasmic chaperone [Acinetobacter rathckeae]
MTMSKKYILPSILVIIASIFTINAYAEIVLHGTRVIYPSNNREVSLQMTNEGERPALVQAWLDDGDANSTPDQVKLPFMITPPVSRVEPTKGQTLRISALPNSNLLNQTQESLYWLNILDIPPRATGSNGSDNSLQLAIRSRIKFIYRPASIKEDVNKAPEQLQWQSSGQQLVVKNPTPFFITITSVFEGKEQQKNELTPKGLLLAPFSEQSIKRSNLNTNQLEFTTINDYGGRVEQSIKLNK